MDVSETEQRVERLTDRLQPLLGLAAPLTDDSSRRDLRRAGESVSDAAGEVPALASDARRALRAAIFIAQTLQGADLGGSLTAVRSLADAAEPAARQLVPTITSLLLELDRGGTRSLAECDRRLSTRAPSARGQIGCLLRTVPSIRGLLRRSLATQRTTRSFTRRIHRLFAESIVIQREILERTRSLDRKTGGPAPPTALTP